MFKRPSLRIDGYIKETIEWHIHVTVCKSRKDNTVVDD